MKWLITHAKDKKLFVGARITITNANIDKQQEMVVIF